MKKFLNSTLKTAVFFIFLVAICNAFAPLAEGVPARPGVITHVQSDGSVVSYQILGDEFFNYMISPSGDLLAFGDSGDLYYANWVSEQEFRAANMPDRSPVRRFRGFTIPTSIRSVGRPAGIAPLSENEMQPIRISIPEFLLQQAREARDKRDRLWREQFDEAPHDLHLAPMLSPQGGSIERNVLIIYVSFANNGGVPSMQGLPIPSAETLHNLMFGNNFGTVAHYFSTVTNGAATIKPAATTSERQGIIFVELPGPHQHWASNANAARTDLVIPAILQAGNPANPGGFINYSNFDVDGNGIITSDELSIGLIVHGYESAFGGPTPAFPSIWGHAWVLPSTQTFNGVRISGYFAQGAYHGNSIQNRRLLTIGILAHEIGHASFGFIDLYDIGGGAGRHGVGRWSLMAGGSWGGSPQGSVPTALDAFHLYGSNRGALGMSIPQLVAPRPVTLGMNTLTGVTQFAKLTTPDPNQFFLVQPRGNAGYDQGFGGNPWMITNSGLLFWLVNDNLSGSNNLTANNHYRVAVVPSTWGSTTLPYNTQGVATDLFSGFTRTFINDFGTPSTRIYASSNAVAPTVNSGWSISNISSTISGQGTNTGTVTASFNVIAAPNAPQITNHPQNQTVAAGSAVSFSATATGPTPLTWRWQRSNDNGSTWNNVGTNSNTFTFTAQTADNNARFRVVISNAHGNVTSNQATLTVNAAPTAPQITSHPQNQTIVAGSAVTFSAAATGTAPLTWQWQRSNNNGSTWNDVGTNSSTFSLTAQMADTNARFRVLISNTHGSTTSNHAVLTVNATAPVITITAQPTADTTVTQGSISGSLSVSASVTLGGTTTYQWYLNTTNSNTGGRAIHGATRPSFTLPRGLAVRTHYFYAVVSADGAAPVHSNVARVTVNQRDGGAGGTGGTGGGGTGGGTGGGGNHSASGGSSGGCNIAVGLLAMLFVLPLLFRRKK